MLLARDRRRPGMKYEARLSPSSELDPVAQQLFMTVPSLHSCIVLEGTGFLWLNRLADEPFIRYATVLRRALPHIGAVVLSVQALAQGHECFSLQGVRFQPTHTLNYEPKPVSFSQSQPPLRK